MKPFVFSKSVVFLLLGVLVVTGVGGYVWTQEHRPPLLEIHVFSMKTGSSILVRTPDDHRILINGGGNSEIVRHVSSVLPFYSHRIDTVIATDRQKKNIGGLVDLIGRYDVGQVIVSAVVFETPDTATPVDATYAELLKGARRRAVPIREVVVGESLMWGTGASHTPVYANIVFPAPAEDFMYSKASPPNIVLDIVYDSARILLAGDSTPKIQRYIVEHASSTQPLDVLVVSHGSSADHFNAEFLETLDPNYLVFAQAISRSSGNAVVPYERRFNSKEKTIRIVSDGSSVNIERVE